MRVPCLQRETTRAGSIQPRVQYPLASTAAGPTPQPSKDKMTILIALVLVMSIQFSVQVWMCQ